MKSYEVCTSGLYTTIAKAINISPALTAFVAKSPTNARHELVTAIYKDLVKAQVKVLYKYQQKGLI